MIDGRLNFKDQVEHASSKTAAVGGALSYLIPNVGGPKLRRRALLAAGVSKKDIPSRPTNGAESFQCV